MTTMLEVASRVAAALDTCEICYAIGGSLASALYGEPRATLDVDLLVAADPSAVDRLATEFKGDFYVDPNELRRAFAVGYSANLIHIRTGIKVDLFPAKSSLQKSHLARRRLAAPDDSGARPLYFYTAEDILLQKLLWYREGGEVSDRQWRDVLAIILTQANALDWMYLRREALTTQLDDLLARARQESGLH